MVKAAQTGDAKWKKGRRMSRTEKEDEDMFGELNVIVIPSSNHKRSVAGLCHHVCLGLRR